MKKVCFVFFALFLVAILFSNETQVTIYNNNFSLIRTKLELGLKAGLQDYYYENIPNTIDAKSVILDSQNNSLQIFSQNYEFDLANTEQIMQKYIGEDVIIQTEEEYYLEGILQFTDSKTIGVLENSSKKLILINRSTIRNITLAKLPDNFYLKPTLRWKLYAPKKAKYKANISYLCDGLSWDVDYNCIWNPETKKLDINSWVTIKNYSGKKFENVKLKLMAGDVNKTISPQHAKSLARVAMYDSNVDMALEAIPEFNEKSFNDFHLYTLDQNVSIANKQIKQIQLFPSKIVKAEQSNKYNTFSNKIISQIKFKNDEASGLKLPLPKGRIKIYQEDKADKSLQFIGEDRIKHTAVNQEVVVTIGNAFDLVGKTEQLEYKKIDRKLIQKKMRVTLENQTKETKEIEVIHNISGDWTILNNNINYRKINAHQIKFIVSIKAGGKQIINWSERIKN